MNDWRVCPWCPEDDCLWPPDAFGAAGNSFFDGPQPCNACFNERYPKRSVPCAACGGVVKTRGTAEKVYHRRCLPVEVRGSRMRRPCSRCGKEVMSTPTVKESVCLGCRREAMGFPRDRPMVGKEYRRIHHRRRYAAAREE